MNDDGKIKLRLQGEENIRNRKILGFFAVFLVATVIVLIAISLVFGGTNYSLGEELVFEINSSIKVADLFESVSGGLENGEALIDTSSLGDHDVVAQIEGPLGVKKEAVVPYSIIDTTAPTIEGEDSFEVFKNDALHIEDYYSIYDNSYGEVEVLVEGYYDTTVVGEYAIIIFAKDHSGNKASRDVVVRVVKDPDVVKLGRNEYFVRVNRAQNVVMVYALGRNGEYANLVKTFVASTGRDGWETPLGIFTVSNRYEALFLVGDVWGHYAVRINGPYFFHSVPYFTKGDPFWDDLEYLEYNKLGEGASAGCVRLAAKDAKWVYDNLEAGTVVEIFDADVLPEGVVKPSVIKIDENSANRGWDPTDADPANPWNRG